jgi:hypothetical protein
MVTQIFTLAHIQNVFDLSRSYKLTSGLPLLSVCPYDKTACDQTAATFKQRNYQYWPILEQQ